MPTTRRRSDTPFRQHMMSAERELIRATLEQHDGNRLDAALALGLHPTTFENKVRKHGLNKQKLSDAH